MNTKKSYIILRNNFLKKYNNFLLKNKICFWEADQFKINVLPFYNFYFNDNCYINISLQYSEDGLIIVSKLMNFDGIIIDYKYEKRTLNGKYSFKHNGFLYEAEIIPQVDKIDDNNIEKISKIIRNKIDLSINKIHFDACYSDKKISHTDASNYLYHETRRLIHNEDFIMDCVLKITNNALCGNGWYGRRNYKGKTAQYIKVAYL